MTDQSDHDRRPGKRSPSAWRATRPLDRTAPKALCTSFRGVRTRLGDVCDRHTTGTLTLTLTGTTDTDGRRRRTGR
eukprot:1181921-Prorocentrum_minimum.AAC.1